MRRCPISSPLVRDSYKEEKREERHRYRIETVAPRMAQFGQKLRHTRRTNCATHGAAILHSSGSHHHPHNRRLLLPPLDADQVTAYQIAQCPAFGSGWDAVDRQHAVGDLEGLALVPPVLIEQKPSNAISLTVSASQALVPRHGQLDEVLPPLLDLHGHHGPHLAGVEPKPIQIEAVADLVVHATSFPIPRRCSTSAATCRPASSASASSTDRVASSHMRVPRASVKRSG